MNITDNRKYWTSDDYLEAREIITDARKNLDIYLENTRMTNDEALLVYKQLMRQGDVMVADYLKDIYFLEVD